MKRESLQYYVHDEADALRFELAGSLSGQGITGLVNQRLLLQCEYLIAENRILRLPIRGQLSASRVQSSCSVVLFACICPIVDSGGLALRNVTTRG